MKHLIIIMAVILSSCATTYEGGTKSQQIADNIHRVSMRGNAFTDTAKANDFAILKAAEITIDNGHRYFVVTNSQDATRHTTYTAPGSSSSTTNTSLSGSTFGNYFSGYASSDTTTTYTPGQTYNFTKPGVDMMIETFKDKPYGSSFDALQVTKYLGVELNPKRWAPEPQE